MEQAEKYIEDFRKVVSEYDFSLEVLNGNPPTPKGIYNYLIGEFSELLKPSIELLLFCIAILIIATLIEEITPSARFPIGVLAVSILGLYITNNSYFNNLVSDKSLTIIESFIDSFVPIFAVVTALSGKVSLSALFGAMSVISIEIFSKFNKLIIFPMILISVLLGLSSKASSNLSKLIVVFQSVLTSLILGIMGLNGFVSNGADTLASKASKALMGSAIPGIGSTLSSGYETVSACFYAAKNLIGVAGVYAILSIITPLLIKCVCLIFVFAFLEILSTAFSNDTLSNVFCSLKSASVLFLSSFIFEGIILVLGISAIILISN